MAYCVEEILMPKKYSSRKAHVRLIHWHEAEAGEKAERLSALGYEVDHALLTGPEGLRELRDSPPDAVVIDLGRIPSHGREVGMALRSYRDTRHVPIVFVGGDPAKVKKVKMHLPDAAYTDWDNIGEALCEALAHPVVAPVVPRSRMEAYEGSPLPKKLGIRPGTAVVLVGAPRGFRKALGDPLEGVSIRDKSIEDLPIVKKGKNGKSGGRRLILWFVRTKPELEKNVGKMAASTPDGGLWIIWPKKGSGFHSDLNQNVIRASGLGAGIVDYKICAVDKTWSGLLFARRK